MPVIFGSGVGFDHCADISEGWRRRRCVGFQSGRIDLKAKQPSAMLGAARRRTSSVECQRLRASVDVVEVPEIQTSNAPWGGDWSRVEKGERDVSEM